MNVDWQRETLLYDQPHPRLAQAAEILTTLPGRKLLDVGCSTAALRRLLPADFEYFGCDVADHAAGRLPAGRFAKVDLNRPDDLKTFAAFGIDVAHLGGVLEYLSNPQDVLRTLRNVVTISGSLVVSMIAFESRRYRGPEKRHPGWIYTPTAAAFTEMLWRTGWRVEERIPVQRRGRPALLRLVHWPGRRGNRIAEQNYYVCRAA